jgi:hypothetical protein
MNAQVLGIKKRKKKKKKKKPIRHRMDTGAGTPRADIPQMASDRRIARQNNESFFVFFDTTTERTQGHTPWEEPKRLDIAMSHRCWAAHIKTDRTTENTQGGSTPTGRKSPNGAQTATQSDMGADLGESPGRANEVEALD